MTQTADRPVALVTGGSRGIGRAICVELAQTGYHVIINYRSDDAGATETLRLVRQTGADGTPAPFDVADGPQSQAAVADLLARFGRMDALVNNAGITADGLFIMMEPENWHRVIQTSLDGFYNVTRPVLEKMVRARKGAVVSIASVAGVMGNRGQANYSAAKAGLIGASRAVAKEVGRLGIRINVVAPGLIDTDMIQGAPVENIKQMIPMARIGRPEEVATVVRFLCSEDAAYITGQVIGVNGGMV
ncbi:MAG: 3-oxoacyl-ACP reductase FabG [Pseudomonadota bacterium]